MSTATRLEHPMEKTCGAFGILLPGDRVHILIDRDAKVPAQRTARVAPIQPEDDNCCLRIPIFQWTTPERNAENGVCLGTLEIGLPSASLTLDTLVTFAINLDGLLTATAVHLRSGEQQSVRVLVGPNMAGDVPDLSDGPPWQTIPPIEDTQKVEAYPGIRGWLSNFFNWPELRDLLFSNWFGPRS